jgi:hypothetical protein
MHLQPHELPPASKLGQRYADLLKAREQAKAAFAASESAARELSALRQWLRDATFETTTPEHFATETAREVLLGREAEAKKRAYRDAADRADAAAYGFDRDYGEYAQAVYKVEHPGSYMDATLDLARRVIADQTGPQ